MASTYHFSSQPVPTGKTASAHFDYIYREGKYDPQKFGEDDIRAVSYDNLPEWAHNPNEFWDAADKFGRANGRSYREINVALQNELDLDDNIRLVEEFIDKSGIGDNHAYVYAIHSRTSVDGSQENIHAHIMFNEKIIEPDRPLDRLTYFRSYAEDAEGRPSCGYRTSTRHSSRQGIVSDRELWEKIVNEKFRERNMDERVSAKSLKAQREELLAQGRTEEAALLDRTPAPHIGNLLKQKGNAEKVQEYIRQFEQAADEAATEDNSRNDERDTKKEEQQQEATQAVRHDNDDKNKKNKIQEKLKAKREELEQIDDINERLLAIYAHDYVVRQIAKNIQKERQKAMERAVENQAEKLAQADMNVTAKDICDALEKRRNELHEEVTELRKEYTEKKKSKIPEEHIHHVALNRATDGEYDRLRKQAKSLEKKLDAVYAEAKKLYPEYYSHDAKYYIDHPEDYKRLYRPVDEWLQKNESPVLREQNKVKFRIEDLETTMSREGKAVYDKAVASVRADNDKVDNEIKKLNATYGKIRNEEKRIDKLRDELSRIDSDYVIFAGKVGRILTKKDKINGKTPVKDLERFVHNGNEYYITGKHGGGKQGGYCTAVRLHDDVTAGSVPTYMIRYHFNETPKDITPLDDKTRLYAGRASAKDTAFHKPSDVKTDAPLPSGGTLKRSPAIQEAKAYRAATTATAATKAVAAMLGNGKKETSNKHTKLRFHKDDGKLTEAERLLREYYSDGADITEDLPEHKPKTDALKEITNAIAAFRDGQHQPTNTKATTKPSPAHTTKPRRT